MSVPTRSSKSNRPPEEDPFRYGWRYATDDDASRDNRIPLTLEDVLHPQEDDIIPERPIHSLERGYLADVLRSCPLGPQHVLVTTDCLINWGVRGMRATSPDAAVFVGLAEPADLWDGIFALRPSQGRCLLAVEIVSPHTRSNDVDRKMALYYRAQIPLYVLLDRQNEDGPVTLVGYRRGKRAYEPMSLDNKKRLHLPDVGLIFGLRDDRLVCIEAGSGRELGDYVRIAKELDEADRKIREQDQALEEAVQARAEAIQAQTKEKRAKIAAQRRARAAENEATAAKQRIRELEEMLRQRSGN